MAKDHMWIKELAALLTLEKEEDLRQFQDLIQKLPLEERKEKGVSWYPVKVVKKGYIYGERCFVTIEREYDTEEAHQFRSGKIVSLFTRQPGVNKPTRSGVIHFVDKKKMKIILNNRDLPDWLGLGLIGVDLLFDDRTYQEMERALRRLLEAKGDRLAELRDIIKGKQEARFQEVSHPSAIPTLNSSQNRAVDRILSAYDIAIIHGPPGTGKTTTLVEGVQQLCKTEASVLVTAPSNAAVDLLTERLVEKGVSVLRIGNISRVDEQIIRHTLEMQMANHPESKNIKKLKIEAAELRRKAKRFRRNFGRQEYRERQSLFKEAGEMMGWANQLEQRLMDELIDGAQVITCTLVGANSSVLGSRRFRTVVIDEAAQALEPANWIPILRASRVVMAGDPFQLPPTVKSSEAQRKGFNQTLLEKGLSGWEHASLLDTQYRMHEVIMGFSNNWFYDNQLKAAAQVKTHLLEIASNQPLQFIDTAGCGFEEKVQEKYQSRYNPDEFKIICEHLYQLEASLKDLEPEKWPSIGLISPYREQVVYMKGIVEEDERLAGLGMIINTIDAFQGQEKDIIYISLVRSNARQEIGFLADYRRMNVAMTRARKQLIIIGDSATVGANPFYEKVLEYCEQEGVYQTAWEYML